MDWTCFIHYWCVCVCGGGVRRYAVNTEEEASDVCSSCYKSTFKAAAQATKSRIIISLLFINMALKS